jgi:hypothetical protein
MTSSAGLVAVQCYAYGRTVNGPYGPDPKWDRITYRGATGYVTDEYVDTKSDEHNGAISTC